MRDAKLGRERLWAFETGRLAEARRSLEVISQQWDQALGQLQAFVES